MKPYLVAYLRVLVIAVCCVAAYSRAAEQPAAVMLVATPELSDPVYGATVLVARPIGGGRFIGFIVNKPTRVTLAEAYPGHGPSSKVTAPIYLGGPSDLGALFALVRSPNSPGEGSMQLAPELFVALTGDTVDQVIEREADRARYVYGAVLWRPGELESEIRRGAWYVDRAEAGVIMRGKTDGLWEELVQRIRVRREGI